MLTTPHVGDSGGVVLDFVQDVLLPARLEIRPCDVFFSTLLQPLHPTTQLSLITLPLSPGFSKIGTSSVHAWTFTQMNKTFELSSELNLCIVFLEHGLVTGTFYYSKCSNS